jgi:hypothetical protein
VGKFLKHSLTAVTFGIFLLLIYAGLFYFYLSQDFETELSIWKPLGITTISVLPIYIGVRKANISGKVIAALGVLAILWINAASYQRWQADRQLYFDYVKEFNMERYCQTDWETRLRIETISVIGMMDCP